MSSQDTYSPKRAGMHSSPKILTKQINTTKALLQQKEKYIVMFKQLMFRAYSIFSVKVTLECNSSRHTEDFGFFTTIYVQTGNVPGTRNI